MVIIGSFLFFSANMTTIKYSKDGEEYDYAQTAEGEYFKNKLERPDGDKDNTRHIDNLATFHFGNDYDYLNVRIYSIANITYETCTNTCDPADENCKNPCETEDKCGKVTCKSDDNCETVFDETKCKFDETTNTYSILSKVQDVQYSENNLIYNYCCII